MDIAGLREETDWIRGRPWTRRREEVLNAAILHWKCVLPHRALRKAKLMRRSSGVFKPWMCDGEGYYAELWCVFCSPGLWGKLAKGVQGGVLSRLQEFRRCRADELAGVLESSHHASSCSTFRRTGTLSGSASSSIIPFITLILTPHSSQFTVVIVSFARVDTLLKIAENLQRSAYIKEIIVAWNNLEVRWRAIVLLGFLIPARRNLARQRLLSSPGCDVYLKLRTSFIIGDFFLEKMCRTLVLTDAQTADSSSGLT